MDFTKTTKEISRNTDLYTFEFGDRIVVCVTYIQSWANVTNNSFVMVKRYRKRAVDRYEWRFDEESFTPEEIESLIRGIENELKAMKYYDEYKMVDYLKMVYGRPPRRLIEVVG